MPRLWDACGGERPGAETALLSCMQIAAYNFHLGLLRPEPFWLGYRKSLLGRREADVLMSSATRFINNQDS
jgi:hypothetical protein